MPFINKYKLLGAPDSFAVWEKKAIFFRLCIVDMIKTKVKMVKVSTRAA